MTYTTETIAFTHASVRKQLTPMESLRDRVLTTCYGHYTETTIQFRSFGKPAYMLAPQNVVRAYSLEEAYIKHRTRESFFFSLSFFLSSFLSLFLSFVRDKGKNTITIVSFNFFANIREWVPQYGMTSLHWKINWWLSHVVISTALSLFVSHMWTVLLY